MAGRHTWSGRQHRTCAALKRHHIAVLQMQDERNQALDRINLLDMELTAVRGNTAGLQMALQKEQQHGAELEATVAAKDKVRCPVNSLVVSWPAFEHRTMSSVASLQ